MPLPEGRWDMSREAEHLKKRALERGLRKLKKNPCDRPPAAPAGVVMTFQAHEARTHLRFSGKVKFDEVVYDTDGLPFANVDRYEVKYRATDASGNPIETEDNFWLALKSATNPVSTTFEFTTHLDNSIRNGDVVVISGCTPSGYNGSWTVSSIISNKVFRVTGGSSGLADASAVGHVADNNPMTRHRAKVRQPIARVRITAATNPTSTTFQYVTAKPNGQSNGNKVRITGNTPVIYNGVFTITSIVNPTTFQVNGGSSGNAAATATGVVADADDHLHILTRELPRPKSWYWQANVRAHSGKGGCWSPWSGWTTPQLPWTSADPSPPAPTFVSLTFDRIGGHHHNAFRGDLRFSPVASWSYSGADPEDDLSRYAWKIESSPDSGANWYKHSHGTIEDKDDGGAGVDIHVHFRALRRNHKYQAWLRSIDRFNRRGSWAGPYP